MADPQALALIDAALRGTLLALLLLLALVFLRDRPRLPAARAGVALTLGLCVQVIGSTPLVDATLPRLWLAPLVAVSVGNAVLFWIFVQAMFDDDFSLRPRHAVAWLAVALLSGINCALVAGSESIIAPYSVGLQRAVPLVFAVLAALAAARHWRSDLVEGRRRLRGFIVVTGIAYTLVMLVARLAAPRGRLSSTTATFDAAALLVIVAVAAWQLLRLSSTELFPSVAGRAAARPTTPADAPGNNAAPAPAGPEPQTEAAAAPDPADERLANALQRVMVEQRIYRSEGLSVAGLAAQLQVPEYRLRRVINQRLGHRNFNAYVNGWRLDEARRGLADPAQRALPVLTIALDAGFQSIGPFNRAFKAATGRTPTEYRKENLADS